MKIFQRQRAAYDNTEVHISYISYLFVSLKTPLMRLIKE